MRKGSNVIVWVLASTLLVMTSLPAQAFSLPALFVKLAASKTLANPGIIIIDPATNTTIYSMGPDVGRAPASVLKLFSMVTVLNALSPELVFNTSLHETADPKTFILVGSGDPWITASNFEEVKYQRAFSPRLIDQLMKVHPGLRTITLDYSNVYATDVQALKRYFAGRLTINAVKVNSAAAATTEIASIKSPPLSKIIEFTLLYSDNVLADRLSRLAAHTMGFTNDVIGLRAAFAKTLTELGISTTGLHLYDGNGLSHQNRVTVRQIAELLRAIRSNPKYAVIYAGLPTAGETGTLKDRFINDAPNAVGLIHAKSGWIDNTVSLAGFVTVGPNEYVFAIVANHIHNLESARQAARVTIDQMLGTIAQPLK
ncbi:MAG: D-alanyl-D-alanine carboxypeptidase [Actinomycetes bacterium]